MPKKASGNFDQIKYQNQWIKENMSEVRERCRNNFVDEFKNACKKLGVSQSDVIKAAMEDTIRKAEGK
ncbi:hypothetical protein [Galactobacillus timonensis]|uniref:hypothetical protein n=1 Tax=Galactobacillus timonensis TaxID=2041840 RepID=UPI002409E551|nr:hypothetical protein [Galactobacillus timonensis]MDD5851793.1 hypothetical protein [Galactobacillus timonensis]MDD6370562.1 hypothetical protein [Galactobacillus timonensis]